MRSARHSFALLALIAAVLTCASVAYAQTDSTQTQAPPAAAPPAAPTEPPAGLEHLSAGYIAGSFPMGDWGKIAGFGLALDGADVIRKGDKAFGLRSSLGLLYNFSRTVDIPSSQLAGSDQLSIETKNWSLFFGLGPEFSAPNKQVTPFVFGTIGFDTYWTSSELAGVAGGSAYAAKHGDSRLSFAWAAGGGIRRQVMPGYMMELSAEYRSGSDHQYLRPQDVTSGPGGVVANRTGHKSDQLIIRIGGVFAGPYVKD
jgi:opacity protein-like surface antigen